MIEKPRVVHERRHPALGPSYFCLFQVFDYRTALELAPGIWIELAARHVTEDKKPRRVIFVDYRNVAFECDGFGVANGGIALNNALDVKISRAGAGGRAGRAAQTRVSGVAK